MRGVADVNRESIWASAKQCRDPETAKEVHRLFSQELEKGWLVGPFTLDSLPPGSLLTRRFGVSQTTTDAVLGQVTKIRPIDDFTESLANLTNSGNETIAPHGIDVVISSFGLRISFERKMGRQPSMVARTIDLRKAYKQLPLSEAALRDSYLCVYNPESVPIQSPALRRETCRPRILPSFPCHLVARREIAFVAVECFLR